MKFACLVYVDGRIMGRLDHAGCQVSMSYRPTRMVDGFLGGADA
jgi:hypothetical protein